VRIDLPVLARGTRWAVILKPAGLAVHRSALVRTGPTVVGVAGRQFGCRVDPVHRLDQPTSGCLLLSFDRDYTGALQQALAAGSKRYLAMVRGCIPTREPYTESRALAVDGVEKEATTWLQPVASSKDPRCSLVMAEPLSGRFHQIRRHLRGLDHPVLGDTTHGDSRENKRWRPLGLNRLALHNFEMRLEVEEGPQVIHAPIPADLLALFEGMPWWPEALVNLPLLGSPEMAA
jgi:tRNA pseudouridine65 synthase